MAKPRTKQFGAIAQDAQIKWASDGGVPLDALEERNGEPSWVLKQEHKALNFFRPEWCRYIDGYEHRWSRSLKSSQCFAVNLFGPLVGNNVLARAALVALVPDRQIDFEDVVDVCFEYTPPGAPEWLGEAGQPTQADVYFSVRRGDRLLGGVLVEVKYTEPEFGSCRGWNTSPARKGSNPNRERCRDAAAIMSCPQTTCWLAETEGRLYWDVIRDRDSSLRPDAIVASGSCPFRGGLYQLMRNRVLADELRKRSNAAWVDFAVCRHLGNKELASLDESVLGHADAIDAFRSLSSARALLDWDALRVLDAIAAAADRLDDWKSWMCRRYFRQG